MVLVFVSIACQQALWASHEENGEIEVYAVYSRNNAAIAGSLFHFSPHSPRGSLREQAGRLVSNGLCEHSRAMRAVCLYFCDREQLSNFSCEQRALRKNTNFEQRALRILRGKSYLWTAELDLYQAKSLRRWNITEEINIKTNQSAIQLQSYFICQRPFGSRPPQWQVNYTVATTALAHNIYRYKKAMLGSLCATHRDPPCLNQMYC